MTQCYDHNSMTLRDFLSLANDFSRLGDAIGSQLLDCIFEGEATEDQNPNAMRRCLPMLRELAEFVVDDIELDGLIAEIEAL